MPPRLDEFVEKSSLGIPRLPEDDARADSYSWLKNKSEIDGAGNLWRIHDNIYDFSSFIDKHPGGSDWLNLTKGTDITEAFETHHISLLPETMLKKYFFKKAESKRAVPFTFKEEGFYRTLKKEVREVLKDLPKQPKRTSDFFIDTLLFLTVVFAILANAYWNYWLGTLAGSLLCSTIIAAHNYFHRRDNFRMYYFNFSLMTVRSWRISHALSHHLYTNTIIDMEMYFGEPLGQYFPVKKTGLSKYGSWIMFPVFGALGFHMHLFLKYIPMMIKHEWKYFLPSDLLGLTLPALMYYFGGYSILSTLGMWTYILCVASLQFLSIGLNAAHHHPDIFHDGDSPRSTEDIDWGISQLDAVMDRVEITGSHFLVLTHFGDHCLHHMFPTFDHGTLDYLYPTFNKVLKEFDINLRMNTQIEMIKGQFQQLCRTEPNPNPPNLNKKYI